MTHATHVTNETIGGQYIAFCTCGWNSISYPAPEQAEVPAAQHLRDHKTDLVTTMRGAIRAQAIENIDQKLGCTLELSAMPHLHLRAYDTEEARLLAELAADPGRIMCQHENRTHSLGGGILVCFACWTRVLLGGRPA